MITSPYLSAYHPTGPSTAASLLQRLAAHSSQTTMCQRLCAQMIATGLVAECFFILLGFHTHLYITLAMIILNLLLLCWLTLFVCKSKIITIQA